MDTPRFIPFLVLAILCSLAGASASDEVDGFAKLTSGDALQMRFTSGGCFHFYTYDLTFTRTNKPTVSVVAVRVELDSPDPPGNYPDSGGRELFPLPPYDSHLVRVGIFFALLRTHQNSGCTGHGRD